MRLNPLSLSGQVDSVSCNVSFELRGRAGLFKISSALLAHYEGRSDLNLGLLTVVTTELFAEKDVISSECSHVGLSGGLI